MPTPKINCVECGASFAALRASAIYCSSECRSAFHNRRKDRGATLYDLFMILRFERSFAAKVKLWSTICRLAMRWNNEDAAERDGRKSWKPYKQATRNLPVDDLNAGTTSTFIIRAGR